MMRNYWRPEYLKRAAKLPEEAAGRHDRHFCPWLTEDRRDNCRRKRRKCSDDSSDLGMGDHGAGRSLHAQGTSSRGCGERRPVPEIGTAWQQKVSHLNAVVKRWGKNSKNPQLNQRIEMMVEVSHRPPDPLKINNLTNRWETVVTVDLFSFSDRDSHFEGGLR